MTIQPAEDVMALPSSQTALFRVFGHLTKTSVGMIVPIAFVAIWWLSTALGFFPTAILPSPFQVGSATLQWAFGPSDVGPYSGTLWEAIRASSERAFVGYAIAAILGVSIGVLIGFYPLMGRLLEPFIHLLRPIPITAWVPLSLLFFGFGFGGAVFLVGLGAFFPIAVNAIEATRGASRNLIRVGLMLGARNLTLLRLFIFPAALPGIFVGLRLGLGLAWVLVIVAELLSVKSGIGYTLLDAYSFNRYDIVISAMIVLGLMGFLSDRVLLAVQYALLRWHREMSIHA